MLEVDPELNPLDSLLATDAVSYTHLDVYKRQVWYKWIVIVVQMGKCDFIVITK